MELVESLRARLAQVHDPELHASIVDLGMVGDISVDADGHATVAVAPVSYTHLTLPTIYSV